MRRRSIPLADVAAFGRRARTTRAFRIVLALALVAALAATYVATTDTAKGGVILQSGQSPVIVLDLSWSVSYDNSALIERTMRGVATSGRRVGLVLFSDIPYEALPPGTRASALEPYVRYFSGGHSPNPWTTAFSAGTRMSSALDLARDMLRRSHVAHGSVVLISDLADSPNDLPALARTLVTYTRDGIPIHVVGVNPVPEDAQYFRDALGTQGGSVTALRSGVAGGGTVPRSRPSFPVAVVVLAALLALLLAVNEVTLSALAWGRRREA